MILPAAGLDDLARVFLDLLRSAHTAERSRRVGYAIDAIEMLPRLHARSDDGQLPRTVDGREFRLEAAGLLNDVRRPAGLAAALLVGRVEDARPEELYFALEQRSAVQFLADDFRETVAEGLVEAELFADGVDEDLAEMLRAEGPFDFAVPPHMPASHWWWALARGETGERISPAAGTGDEDLPAEVTYFAWLRPGETLGDPFLLLRKARSGADLVDELLGRDGKWRPTDLFGSIERGETPGEVRQLGVQTGRGRAQSIRNEYALVERALARQQTGEFPLRMAATGPPEDEEPLDAEGRAEIVAFLTGAPLVEAGPDGVFRTDGMWVWPESIAETVLATGLMPSDMFHVHIQARLSFFPDRLGPGVLERAQRLLEVARTAEDGVEVREPEERTKAQRMAELGSWHSEWVRKHEATTPFRPELNRDVEDYNLHYVDLEASAEAQREYDQRAAEILGLDPETGQSIDY